MRRMMRISATHVLGGTMSTTPPPAFPPLPPVPPTPPRRPRTNAIIVGSAAAVIAAIISTGVVVQSTGDDTKPAAAKPSLYGSDGTVDAVEESEPEPAPTYAALTPADFAMTLRTTERQCFGSAGCNVTVEPILSYAGEWNGVDPDAVYSITYEIRGDESGPVIETAELSAETTLNYTPTSISTASASKKVSVKITDVVMQGG
ncbi:hypothetical protein [Streptomyces bobili]|uniref:hypothetical protein n=1 Tax=Streptomyces bobili TaxID=67280 RepID=UPI001FCA39CC|nr:hypothetical protein [Streptomyces bobili]